MKIKNLTPLCLCVFLFFSINVCEAQCPSSNTSGSQQCENNTNHVFSLGNHVTNNIANGTWSFVSYQTTITPINQNPPVNTSPIPNSFSAQNATFSVGGNEDGTYIFRYTYPANMSCSAGSVDITLIIKPVRALVLTSNIFTGNCTLPINWACEIIQFPYPHNGSVVQETFNGIWGGDANTDVYIRKTNGDNGDRIAINCITANGSYNFKSATGGEPSCENIQTVTFNCNNVTNNPCPGGGGGTDCNYLLPVTLQSFSAKKLGEQTYLTWATASEKNSSHFIVERSIDGKKFMAIGEVKAAGNSSEKLAYQFEDSNPLSIITFYRLKMVDFDGKSEYSNIVSLENKGAATPLSIVYPNPASDELTVEYNAPKAIGDLTADVYDTTGRLVFTKKIKLTEQLTSFQLPLYTIPFGSYVLRLSQANSVTQHRFVKK